MDFSIISENLKLLKDTNVLIDVETVQGSLREVTESRDSVQYVMLYSAQIPHNTPAVFH